MHPCTAPEPARGVSPDHLVIGDRRENKVVSSNTKMYNTE